MPWVQITLSSSPENSEFLEDMLLLCGAGAVSMLDGADQPVFEPIKGTILRGETVEEDQENAIQLVNSSKDRAENLMIVDLLRNDIGRNCEPGSIRVPELFSLELSLIHL